MEKFARADGQKPLLEGRLCSPDGSLAGKDPVPRCFSDRGIYPVSENRSDQTGNLSHLDENDEENGQKVFDVFGTVKLTTGHDNTVEFEQTAEDGASRTEPRNVGKWNAYTGEDSDNDTRSADGDEKTRCEAVKCILAEYNTAGQGFAYIESNQSVEIDETRSSTWFDRHIKRRECSCFIPEPSHIPQYKENKRICQCGYMYDKHSEGAKRSQPEGDVKWEYKKHSEQKSTNAFGDIEFVGYGSNVGKYVRVDVDTEMSDMLHLMRKIWGLDKPNLLISVTGGAKGFQMNKRLKETFRRGLMKTVLTTGAWIVTGGTYAGIYKDVGEAVKAFRVASSSKIPIISIGIAPWGCIQNKEALIHEKYTSQRLASYKIETEEKPEENFLDPNHTHFILVDNATEHKFEAEIPFRARLENEIAKIRTDTGDNAVSVPIVLLVLEGGPETLETVQHAIQNNTPSVIVKGSGRAADILAYAYQNAKEDEIEEVDQEGKTQKRTRRFMDGSLLAEVRDKVEKEFKDNVDTHVRRIKDCLDKCDFISVFEQDNKSEVNGLDIVMLQTLLKANKNHVMDQLRLALAWNRIDVAKSDIFTDDKRWSTGSLDDIMLLAIQLDRTDFIELFLDHGVSLREFLTKDKLLKLYNRIPSNCLLRTLLDRAKSKEYSDFSLSDVESLVQDLLEVAHVAIDPANTNDKDSSAQNSNEQKPDFDNPCQQLFIWSVLMIQQDMAKLFWAEGKDAIAGALVANSILSALKAKTEDIELLTNLQHDINEWSDLAVEVLSDCYATDEHKAQDLLVRELTNWGDTTCMLIAVKADNKDFISQTACQSLLNSVWMGKLAQDNSYWRLLLCALFPPLALVLLKFQSKPGGKSNNNLDNPETDEMGVGSRTTSRKAEEKDETEKRGKPVPKKMHIVKERICNFFNAPVIIFIYNVLSYIVFLGLFTYVLIFNFNPNVSTAEICLMFWVFTMFSEEIRQVATTAQNSVAAKLKSYFTDLWNIVDIVTIGLFIIGMILRFLPYSETFEAARVFLALNFVSFSLRLLHIFFIHKTLGPKLVMIGRMVKDLMSFLAILMVFVVSYAIASYSILFPNAPLRWSTTIDVIRKSYWNIYGDLFLGEIEGTEECTYNEALWLNGTQSRCPTDTGKVVVPILMGVYMLLANVLLLNLLIAMFSYTFTMIQDNTDKHWFFQRYFLIYEYDSRPVLCAPLIFFSHVYLLIKFICSCCCCKTRTFNLIDNEDDFRRKFENKRELEQWEDVIVEGFHEKSELEESESMEYKVNDTNNLLKNLIDEIQGQKQQRLSETESTTQLEHRLNNLEKNMEKTHDSLKWMMQVLYEGKIASNAGVPPDLSDEMTKRIWPNKE